MSEPHHFARLLGANPFFADLGTEVVEAIAGLCVTRSLRTEEVAVPEGRSRRRALRRPARPDPHRDRHRRRAAG